MHAQPCLPQSLPLSFPLAFSLLTLPLENKLPFPLFPLTFSLFELTLPYAFNLEFPLSLILKLTFPLALDLSFNVHVSVLIGVSMVNFLDTVTILRLDVGRGLSLRVVVNRRSSSRRSILERRTRKRIKIQVLRDTCLLLFLH